MSTDSGYTTHPQQPPLKKGIEKKQLSTQIEEDAKNTQ